VAVGSSGAGERIEAPYLLYLGEARDDLAAKSAHGLIDWRPEWCLGQVRLDGCKADLGIADMTIDEAAARGARTLIVGVANPGGVLPASWSADIVRALELGMDVASGLHMKLADMTAVREAATRNGGRLFDVRHPTRRFATGTGAPRPGKRLLTVGTDCSCGKMYTALALEREMKGRGLAADFRATGQSGIFIAGGGVAVDAVVADFISGAVEWLSPDNEPEHWDLIEGQGSLFHPSFAGVSLGLLHGAQPDALVMCHEPTRAHMRGLEHQPLPALEACIDANLEAAALTNPAVRCAAIAVNTSSMEPAAAAEFKRLTEAELRIPCVDPMAEGVAAIVDQLV
jgi:uncharacterized NAD-dependent epimerase/dehydratase family protein